MATIAGLNYAGRDGELHILDNSQASAGAAATPWGIKVIFEQMDFKVPFQNRPEELVRLDRQRLSQDSHLQVGSEENMYQAVNATFGFAMASLHTDAVLQFVGIDFAQLEGAYGVTITQANRWTVKGTPTVGLISTKARALAGSGQYDGGRIDTKGSAIALQNFADKKKVAVDVEIMFTERGGANPFGYRMKEVNFSPGQQSIAESADFVIVSMTGMVYGEIERITAFARALDITTSGGSGAAGGASLL